MFVGFVLRHQKILRSDHTPMEHSRTYRSAKPTPKRLVQAHAMCRRLRQLTQLYARTPSGARESWSTHPPATCRIEWHPKRYAPSRNVFAARTRVPTPIPNDTLPVATSLNQSASQTSIARMRRTQTEMNSM